MVFPLPCVVKWFSVARESSCTIYSDAYKLQDLLCGVVLLTIVHPRFVSLVTFCMVECQ